MPEPTLLDKLHALRSTKVDDWAQLIDAREADRVKFEERDTSADNKPTDADVEAYRAAEVAFRADSDLREAEIKELDERIRQHADIVDRRAAAAAAPNVQVISSPLTYRQDNQGQHSYFRDLAVKYDRQAASRLTRTDDRHEQRLQQHAMEMDVEMPKRAAERERRAQAQVEQAEVEFRGSFRSGVTKRGLDVSPFERRVNPSRLDGQGGYFVPPLWLPEYIAGLRAGRVAAGMARQMDLPMGTDSINLPKLATLTQVGVQGADNQGVTSQDFTDTSVQANVKTLAGQEDVAIQLLDQSPYHLDQVIMEDLTADYNRLVDRQVVFGNGTNSAALNGGQILGIYPQTNWASTNTITATMASVVNAQYFPAVLGAMASQIAKNRFDLTNLAYLLHPSRWFWYATSLDTLGRPLVEASPTTAYNPGAMSNGEPPAEGLVGNLSFGPQAYISANVPTNDSGSGTGSGGTNDVAIAAKWDDVWLFEGEMRTRVLPEVLSGTLEVRFQVYNYVAFLVRYGQSLAVGSGTYFATPAGPVSGPTGLVF